MGAPRIQELPLLNFKRPANVKKFSFERVFESFEGQNADVVLKTIKQNPSKFLGMQSSEMTMLVAWLECLLISAGYLIPGWKEAGSAAAQILLLLSGEIPVK